MTGVTEAAPVLQLPLAADYSRKRAGEALVDTLHNHPGRRGDACGVPRLGTYICPVRCMGRDNHSPRTELDSERRDSKC
jgi:hypothetical protein